MYLYIFLYFFLLFFICSKVDDVIAPGECFVLDAYRKIESNNQERIRFIAPEGYGNNWKLRMFVTNSVTGQSTSADAPFDSSYGTPLIETVAITGGSGSLFQLTISGKNFCNEPISNCGILKRCNTNNPVTVDGTAAVDGGAAASSGTLTGTSFTPHDFTATNENLIVVIDGGAPQTISIAANCDTLANCAGILTPLITGRCTPAAAKDACSDIVTPTEQGSCDSQSVGTCSGGGGTECTSVVDGPEATCTATMDDTAGGATPCAWTATNMCTYSNAAVSAVGNNLVITSATTGTASTVTLTSQDSSSYALALFGFQSNAVDCLANQEFSYDETNIASWTHTQIVANVGSANGIIYLQIGNIGIGSSSSTIISNLRMYSTDAMTIKADANSDFIVSNGDIVYKNYNTLPIPTSGSATKLSIYVEKLESVSNIKVEVGDGEYVCEQSDIVALGNNVWSINFKVPPGSGPKNTVYVSKTGLKTQNAAYIWYAVPTIAAVTMEVGTCAGGADATCTNVAEGPATICTGTNDSTGSPCAWTATINAGISLNKNVLPTVGASVVITVRYFLNLVSHLCLLYKHKAAILIVTSRN